MHNNLVKQFNDVGLRLKLLSKPMGFRTNVGIFQMDIKRKVAGTRRTEWFEIYPGDETNKIQIIDVDKKLNQILLLVQEKERFFETEERKRYSIAEIDRRREALIKAKTFVRETPKTFVVRNKTSAMKRHFQIGRASCRERV